ncbi:EAL domain-containing protein [Novosphingobium sp. G106]|uniref:putative bifunctional diguanylate cyclase/phosphodiesterase n=1 Tax=Novosphingobium sp. G106 TaxID=2849500 RepID=UPI001C2CFA3A|nr:EAL domain-containing protein [Novosphingobium sp. G106]MBV1691905.1 EAL domain-containing protein [Novosphingobium sp. G106]
MKFPFPFRQWEAKAGAQFEVAQVGKLRRQIAPLYVLLTLSAASLAFTYRTLAPVWLTLVMPALLIAACMTRMIGWGLMGQQGEVTPAQARTALRRTTVVGAMFAVTFSAWTLALDQYGGIREHSHLAMFVAISVLGCVFCLGYHPRAASVICLIDVGTFLVHSFNRGSKVDIAIAINVALVTAVILKVLRDSFASFITLEISQRALEQKREETQNLCEENALLAQTDALTGLPNRRFFFAELERMLAADGQAFTVAVLDLDGFKPVNDGFGHALGDQLLQIIAHRLRPATDSIVAARLGGDEFGLLIKHEAPDAIRYARWICDKVKESIPLSDATVTVGCSLGLASYPEVGRTAQDLFDRADFALYYAKSHKRGGYVIFSSELAEIVRSDREIEKAFQVAELERELTVAFQPIFATNDLALVGVEALARWNSPHVGIVSPEQLISAAERAGMARRTTLTLFGKALEGAAWLPENVRLNFNLSALDVADDVTVSLILERLDMSGLRPERIVFELTENALVKDLDAARVSLERLRNTGAKLALDDFGTGFSSLSTLHRLPFDIVKVDRSFAARLHDAPGRRLIAAIRGLADALSLQCVLEGIETEEQLHEATAAGFGFVQGYHLASPGLIGDVLAALELAREAA